MKKTVTILVVIVVIFILFLITGPFYVIQEGEQALVIRFGRIIAVEQEAGLKIKVPFVDNVNRYPKKILAWDGESQRIPTEENQFIWVDTTARWKISDPKLFYESVGTITGAQSRLDDVIDSSVRKIISRNPLVEAVRNSNVINEILRTDVYASAAELEGGVQAEALGIDTTIVYDPIEKGRQMLSEEMFTEAVAITPQYGIILVDIIIRQIKYSDELTESVYRRMIAERNQIAQAFRSDGEGRKAAILGEMQRELNSIQSNAFRQSEEIKGGADAQAAALYATTYNRNPDFYEFWKALESYKEVLPSFRKTLTTDAEFFDYLYDQLGR
ncbi:MAG: protease modulator HflC [Spirochaetales bacterium]|nr:protease modulator HflC [Spirochaetales bacterium]